MGRASPATQVQRQPEVYCGKKTSSPQEHQVSTPSRDPLPRTMETEKGARIAPSSENHWDAVCLGDPDANFSWTSTPTITEPAWRMHYPVSDCW